jgi:uncharacterized membrane-anchored protein YhcB (DUF1043 family)
MIDLIIALTIGIVLGYLSKKEQTSTIEIQNQLKKQEEEIEYYRKVCKLMANENMEMRRKVGGWNNPDLRTYDGKLK